MKKKFLISIWSDPSMYINLLFLINFLLEKKFEIILICKKIERKKDFYFFVKKNKTLKIIEILNDGKKGYIDFYRTKKKFFKKFQPNILISINFISLFISKLIPKQNIIWIYYNFDFDLSNKLILKNFLERIMIKKVDYIFLPSKSRMNLYRIKFKRKKNIFSINNCFSKNFKIEHKSKLKKYDFLKNKKYLIRLGSFYKHHFLEELILSTKYWKNNYILVSAGKSYGGYYEHLKNFIIENNIKKVLMIKNTTYDLWFFLLKHAIAGFALYQQINTSHKLMGGTSQKLNNYIFRGIPSILIRTKDTTKFNNRFETSILTKGDEFDIAKKTNFLLNNKKFYKKIKKNNHHAFLKEFNFEKQIKKVIKLIT